MTENDLKDLGIEPNDVNVSDEEMMASLMENDDQGEAIYASEEQSSASHNDANGFSLNNSALNKVKLDVTVELGRLSLPYVDVENLTRGSVLTLDKKADEFLTLSVNDSPIARCSVEKVDGQFTLTVESLEGYKG